MAETVFTHICIPNLEATTGYILVDKSDQTNYKHTGSGDLRIDWVHYWTDPDSSYRGDIYIGVITRVDATNADVAVFECLRMDRAAVNTNGQIDYGGRAREIDTGRTNFACGTLTNLTAFQTDATNATSIGGTANPAVGDIVIYVTRTAGALDVSFTIGYYQEA